MRDAREAARRAALEAVCALRAGAAWGEVMRAVWRAYREARDASR